MLHICYIYLPNKQQQKTKVMNNTTSITSQINALIMDENFRNACAKTAKANGITSNEWNENKVNILYMWATQVICGK